MYAIYWLAGHKPELDTYMSFTQNYFPQDYHAHTDRLTRQSEYLRVRNFHLQCKDTSLAPELREKYRDIAALLGQVICQYEELLAALQSK
jgi:hypothetical protein